MQFYKPKFSVDDLIVGFLKHELTPDQTNELVAWIQQSKENKHYFDEFREIWLTSKALDEDRFDYEKAFANFIEKAEPDAPVFLFTRKQWLGLAKYAAVFIVAFLLGGWLLSPGKFQFSGIENRYSEIVVPRGAKASFTLLDGTHVTLNAGSKLRYNARYGIHDRIVELEGEGYFKVSKDTERPFIVKTSHMSVRALGTEFNVKAYPGDKTIETTLVEGLVKIEKYSAKNEVQEIVLKPNQKVTYYKEDVLKESDMPAANIPDKPIASVNSLPADQMVKEDVQAEALVSWKENRWIIEKQDLSKLATELERKFDIQILFTSERLKNFRFTGTLLDEPLEQVLKVMSITAPINYEINGKKVTFTERENFESIYKKLYKEKKNN